MAAIIGALRGVLSMDSAAFENGAKRAQATMGKTERRMVQMGTRMEKAGRRMALGLTLPLVGAAAVAVKSSLQVVDAQAKMAQSLGTTVRSMQVLERAADLSGVSVGEVQQATIQLTKRLSQAAGGSGAAAKALKRLHLNASQLQRLPLDERLGRIQDAIGEYVPVAERAALASDLFGSRAGLIFTRIDGAALRTAAQDVDRFGVAVSDVDADRLELANDAMSRMGVAGRGLANQLTIALVPAMQAVSDGAASVAEWFNGLGDGTKRVIALGTAGAAALGPLALGLGLVLKLTAPLGVAMAGMLSTVALAPVRFAAAARSAVALEMALGATTTRAALGSLAIKGLSRGLVLLRGAVIATGIGALVVGAGYLAMKFHQLVTATGGWGMALQALGDLADGVWEGIKTSARAIGPALGAVWEAVKAGFLRMMGTISENWSAFLSGLAVRVKNIPGMSGAFDALNEASGRAFEGVARYDALAVRAANSSAALKKEAKGLVREGWEKATAALKTLTLQMDSANAELDAGDDSADALAESLEDLNDTLDDGSGGGTKGKLKGTTKEAKDLTKELTGPLSSAVDGVARSFGDWVADGFRDFESMWDGIKNAARRGLSDLASTFAQNRLQVFLGLSAAGTGTAANAGPAVLGGGGVNPLGLLSNVGGLVGGGGIAAGIGSGLGGVLSGGGLGSSFANLGGLVSGASSGWGALGAALPAAGLVLGGLAVLAKGLSRKYAGSGIRGSFGVDGFEGSSIDFYKGGFLRSNRTDYKPLDAALEATLDQSITGLADGVRDMAGMLNLGTDALEGFTSEGFTLWTNGKSQEQIQQELQGIIADTGAEMAELVLGTEDFSRAGETALDTLSRLSTGLAAVNDAADILGLQSFDASLLGGADASALVDQFGGVDQMTAAVSTYWSAFYSETERSETSLRRLRERFADLNLSMPDSRAGFRAMVEGIDLTTEAGRELFAELLQLGGALNEALPAAQNLSAALSGMVGTVSGHVDLMISQASSVASEAARSAQEWLRAGEALRDLRDDLRFGSGSLLAPGDQLAAVEAEMNRLRTAAEGGDVEAAQAFGGVARRYLELATSQAGSLVDAQRISAHVAIEANRLAGLTDVEGAADTVLEGLARQQLNVLQELKAYLQDADTIDGAVIAQFEARLGALQGAIDGSALSLDFLRDGVALTIDQVDLSGLSPAIRTLIENGEAGLSSAVEFILNTDALSPGMRWLALQSTSQHIRTIAMLPDLEGVPDRIMELALGTGSDLVRNVRLAAGADLDPELLSAILSENADLSRSVNLVLGSELRPGLMRLALGGTGDYAVAISASLEDGVSDEVRGIIAGGAGSYSSSLDLALSGDLRPRELRQLLSSQRGLLVGMDAAFEEGVSDAQQQLLLNTLTNGTRALAIEAHFGDELTQEQRDLLAQSVTSAERLVNIQSLSDLTKEERMALRAQNRSFRRVMEGQVDLTGLNDQQRGFFDAISGGAGGLLSLDGSFGFDPTGAFAASMQETVGGPIDALGGHISEMSQGMSDLSAAMGALRSELAAERQQAAAAAADAARVVKLEDKASRFQGNWGANSLAKTTGAFEKLQDLVAETGVSLGGLRLRDDGTVAYSGSGVAGTASQLAAFRASGFWADGGLQDQIAAANANRRKALAYEQSLRERIGNLGGVPGFAMGGVHTGGWRVVGERGWELENTGASRVISHSDSKAMLDNRGVVALLEQVLSRLDSFHADTGRGLAEVASAADDLVKLERLRELIGVPPVREPT
jgi:hypothetical protein